MKNEIASQVGKLQTVFKQIFLLRIEKSLKTNQVAPLLNKWCTHDLATKYLRTANSPRTFSLKPLL